MPRYQNLLIDGLNLMHRAGHNYTLGYWEGGEYRPVGIVYGFISMALSLVRKYGDQKQGVRLVVCWDAGYKHRTDLYPNYKISRRTPREKVPGEDPPEKTENQETFREQRDVLRGVLDLMGWEQARASDYEADDVMATLAVQADARGETCGVYTTDGDLQQVVSDRVNVISSGYGKDKIWTPLEVVEKWGFPADRVAELKGLQGDSGDDIPGCPGCGMGWAQKLLGQYGSIEGVLTASEKGLLQGDWGGKPWKAKKLTETFRENANLVRVSHELAKVVRDCPVVVKDTYFDDVRVRAEFGRMAFHSLLDEKNFDLLRSLGRTKQVEEEEDTCDDLLGMFS